MIGKGKGTDIVYHDTQVNDFDVVCVNGPFLTLRPLGYSEHITFSVHALKRLLSTAKRYHLVDYEINYR